MKIINDTLKTNGKWSQKRLLTFSSFYIAVIYAFTPIIISDFEIYEFVFLGLLGVGGFSLFRIQKSENNNLNNQNT